MEARNGPAAIIIVSWHHPELTLGGKMMSGNKCLSGPIAMAKTNALSQGICSAEKHVSESTQLPNSLNITGTSNTLQAPGERIGARTQPSPPTRAAWELVCVRPCPNTLCVRQFSPEGLRETV